MIFGFIGETLERIGPNGITVRAPPHRVLGNIPGAFAAPRDGVDVWIGFCELADEAEAEALEAAAQARGIRLRVLHGASDDTSPSGTYALGPVRRAILQLLLEQRGITDITLDDTTDERTLFDWIVQRNRPSQSRAYLKAKMLRRRRLP